MTNSRGRSLELFYIDGRPDGMLTAEVFNWTGHVLMTPRTQLAEALKRREAGYTGVYLLLGELEGEPRLYIGEGEDIGDRIRSHDAKKEWWTSAVFIVSSANSLNKAHVKYLESRLVEEARAVSRIPLENGNTPARSSLSESNLANMESFIENVFMILPALRIDAFVRNTRPALQAINVPTTELAIISSDVFEMKTPKHNVNALAFLEDGEFVVQKGSVGRKEWSSAAGHSYAALFDQLVRSGILEEYGSNRIFAENYAFQSPSAAGSVLNGRPTNGQEVWKLSGSEKSYRQWEAERLSNMNPS